MSEERKILRLCTGVILCAVLLRLLGQLFPAGTGGRQDLASVVLFLQTGRIIRQVDTSNLPQETVPPLPTEPALPEKPSPVVFTAEDASLVQVYDYAGKKPDVAALLQKPLALEAQGVLIYHTHASESYENTEGYEESSEYRTLDERYNMLSVGRHLADCLEEAGLSVQQDRQLHDHPSYNGSYSNSYGSARAFLEADPEIGLVLDIHRDAATDDAGRQVSHTVQTDRGTAARLMLVVGAGNENWQENMALAVKLQVQLEKLCPGICRPICLRSSGFNQVLSPGALLIEMGSAGNTRQEALLAAEYLAQAIAMLTADSTS